MASPPLINHHTMVETSLDDCLSIYNPKVATVSLLEVKNTEYLVFDATNVIALIKNNLYSQHVLQNHLKHVTTVCLRLQ